MWIFLEICSKIIKCIIVEFEYIFGKFVEEKMVFSSLIFIFYFLPGCLIFYYLLPRKFKNLVLLIFSLMFYGYSGIKFLIIMLVSIFANYVFGMFVYKFDKDKKRKNLILFLSIAFNLLFLGYYKYTNFFVNNINKAFNTNIYMEKIILPIGISFFTFQAMSYVIDVYRGDGRVQKNPLNVALYISFFPQLIAGPIVRYEDIDNQITKREETLGKFSCGIERFILGLAKKVLIANTMGKIADEIFALSYNDISTLLAWIGAIAYSLQIYFDFSGYSDMAIGLAKMFGFELLENFNYPYISTTISEFWRRWHISLGTWFRDYVYIPLGGNRCKIIRNYFNLFVVWFLTGMWHGASWTFIAWGLYFGVIIAIEKMFLEKFLERLWKPVRHLYAILLIVVGWVLFRSEGFRYAFGYLKTMFGFNSSSLFSNLDFYYIHDYWFIFLITFIASTPFLKFIKSRLQDIRSKRLNIFINDIFVPIVYSILFLTVIMYLLNSTFNPFIYFRF